MEHVSSSLDLPVSEMQTRMVGHVTNNSESQYFAVSKDMGMVEPVSRDPGFKNLVTSDNRVGQNESLGGRISSSPIWTTNQLGWDDSVLLNGTHTSLPVKRKADVGPLLNNSVSQPSLLPNKRPAYVGPEFDSFGAIQSSTPDVRGVPAQPKLGSQGLQVKSMLNKKMVRNDSMPGKSSQPQGQATKAPSESSEAVRSKMRESLSSALALASQTLNKVSKTEKDQSDSTITHKKPVDSQGFKSDLTAADPFSGSGSLEVFPSKELAVVGETKDFQVFSSELPPMEGSGVSRKIFQEFAYSTILPDEDVSFTDNFFVKDDLLQGNGLSWAFEFDEQTREAEHSQDAEKPQSVKQEDQGHTGEIEKAILTPDNRALEIEAELFKLFGGVNKKYKEKGRSLLFNLKDRSNPELRERVMSGEISPERLCSMSAEELASKELSQWRTAKAEEFAQMVVLPDTEVDIRRLVRKTHKGEFQVEVEHDDGIMVEVSGGTSVFTRPPSEKDAETHSPPKASPKDRENAGQRNSLENQEFSGSLIIPTDGTDLMQGIMVDEMKDPAFLPPIVSLDEFMESLNTEPPFENLSTDAEAKAPSSHEESSKVMNNSRASEVANNAWTSGRASNSPKDASSKKVKIVKKHEVDTPMKSTRTPAKQRVFPSTSPKVEYMWEGNLQLSISSSVTVGGLFQSGEKTPTKDWPISLEIKGRVKLGAFEKFLQDLPMSRTRAVMVLQFVLKDKSSENERSYFSEAVDSFASDERLGYAEPAAGVELYLCPPTPKITDMLNKLMPKERQETNNSNENGLIGIVVWRRAQISNTISPNSSSHHKHSSKKQSFTPIKRVQDSSIVNANTPNRTPLPVLNNVPRSNHQPELEEEDDVPPGFGPTAATHAAKDDDDLPEFNFSGNLNQSAPKIPVSQLSLPHGMQRPQPPVDKVRELIKKYGQSGSSTTTRSLVDDRRLGIEPWNDDDDDDMPEWRPQAPLPLLHHRQPHLMVHGQRPPLHLLPTNQHIPPGVTHPPPRGPPPAGRWVQPPGPAYGAGWRRQ